MPLWHWYAKVANQSEDVQTSWIKHIRWAILTFLGRSLWVAEIYAARSYQSKRLQWTFKPWDAENIPAMQSQLYSWSQFLYGSTRSVFSVYQMESHAFIAPIKTGIGHFSIAWPALGCLVDSVIPQALTMKRENHEHNHASTLFSLHSMQTRARRWVASAGLCPSIEINVQSNCGWR